MHNNQSLQKEAATQKNGSTWGSHCHGCPPSFHTAHVVRSPRLAVIASGFGHLHMGRASSRLSHTDSNTSPWPVLPSMVQQEAMTFGAIELLPISNFTFIGCHVLEDHDPFRVLGHQVGRVPPAKYLGNSEILQSDVLLDPLTLDCPCA